MKILQMTLKKKWFDMIASGEKKEEYREVKPYWINRLTWHEFHTYEIEDVSSVIRNGQAQVFRRDIDAVCFKNGYAKDAPTITLEFEGIEIGEAKPEWSDNWQGEVFIIKLGKILKRKEPVTSYAPAQSSN